MLACGASSFDPSTELETMVLDPLENTTAWILVSAASRTRAGFTSGKVARWS